jgi:hypothetical protein
MQVSIHYILSIHVSYGQFGNCFLAIHFVIGGLTNGVFKEGFEF